MSDQLEQKQNCVAGNIERPSRLLSLRPPRIAITLLAAAVGLHLLSPAETILFLPFMLLGFLSLVAGFSVMMWAWVLFTRSRTAICPTESASTFIERPPFSFTRNPMYLGMILMLVGAAFLLGSVAAFTAPVVFFVIINDFFIPYEERDMVRLFGGQFLDYRQRVRRWL